MGALTKVTVRSSISVCIGMSHCHPVIAEERPGDSSGNRHWGKPRKLLLLFWFSKATLDRWPCQRLCSTRVAHAGVNLHSRGKPGMNYQVNRWDPAAFLVCCRDQRGGHFQPCKFLMAKFSLEMLVSMFGHALLWALGRGNAPSPGQKEWWKPLPARVLPCTAEPLLELALLCRGRGWIWSPVRHRQPVLSCPSVCALWMMSSSCCLGVHSCVGIVPGWAVLKTLTKYNISSAWSFASTANS